MKIDLEKNNKGSKTKPPETNQAIEVQSSTMHIRLAISQLYIPF